MRLQVVAIVVFTTLAFIRVDASATTKAIDIRNASTDKGYSVTFASRGPRGITGASHAIVIVGHPDASGKITYSEYGFNIKDYEGAKSHPKDAMQILRAATIGAPGYLDPNDKMFPGEETNRLTVQVDARQYADTMTVVDRWMTETPSYILWRRTCTSLVADVGDALRLPTPVRLLHFTGDDYISSLIENIDKPITIRYGPDSSNDSFSGTSYRTDVLVGDGKFEWRDQGLPYTNKLVGSFSPQTFQGTGTVGGPGGGAIAGVDGAQYSGAFEYGVPNGAGTLLFDYHGPWQYQGHFSQGRFAPNDSAQTRSPNGNVTQGVFQDGKCTGICKLTFADGSILTVTFLNGHPDGTGKLIDASGRWAVSTWTQGVNTSNVPWASPAAPRGDYTPSSPLPLPDFPAPTGGYIVPGRED